MIYVIGGPINENEEFLAYVLSMSKKERNLDEYLRFKCVYSS